MAVFTILDAVVCRLHSPRRRSHPFADIKVAERCLCYLAHSHDWERVPAALHRYCTMAISSHSVDAHSSTGCSCCRSEEVVVVQLQRRSQLKITTPGHPLHAHSCDSPNPRCIPGQRHCQHLSSVRQDVPADAWNPSILTCPSHGSVGLSS